MYELLHLLRHDFVAFPCCSEARLDRRDRMTIGAFGFSFRSGMRSVLVLEDSREERHREPSWRQMWWNRYVPRGQFAAEKGR